MLYIEKRGIQVHCADSLEVNYPRDIDLLVTDPPYGKVYQSNRSGSTKETIHGDTDQEKIDAILLRVWKSLRPHRHAYIFGPRRDLGHAATSEIIWDKRYSTQGNLSNPWGQSHETIWFYAHRYRSEPRTGELAARLRRGTILTEAAPRGSATRNHPNAKPVRLWQRLIESSSHVGDVVVDPFMGGGSSAVACLLLGRRYVGSESDPVYAERAANWVVRVADALDQSGL